MKSEVKQDKAEVDAEVKSEPETGVEDADVESTESEGTEGKDTKAPLTDDGVPTDFK